MTTVTWMWIGNKPMLDSSPSSNITQTQANAAVGWDAHGSDEMKATDVSGPIIDPARWQTSYQGTFFSPATTFTYTNPAGASVSTTVVTFVTANFAVETEDAAGNRITVTKPGVLMQTANGDVFFRPAAQTINEWNDIKVLYGITVRSVATLPNNENIAKVGFNPSIKDVTIPPCFVTGTLIETEAGFVTVENLKVGDKVLTRDNGFKEISWIGSVQLSAAQLQDNPNHRPIRISAGALGPDTPSSDLLVSPQHRVLVRSKIAQRMFGANEVLVAAKQLLLIDGIDIADDLQDVRYFHILFDQHEIVNSNGAPTESLYTGRQAMKSLGSSARQEIFSLFPELREDDHEAVSARTLASGRMARKLAVRHRQNEHPLYLG